MPSSNHVTFFISTGRCGTQWLAHNLSAHYGDLAVVEHEPHQVEYRPRFYFDAYHRQKQVTFSGAIADHLSFIVSSVERHPYIETGWPVYGALPHILPRFAGRVRIVHLYRNPLRVAASLTTHNVYNRGQWSEVMSITPADCGVSQASLAGGVWAAMTDFEKCLFWWTEINGFAFRLREQWPSVPWLSVKFEDLFSERGRIELTRITEFLSLPRREGFLDSLGEKKDSFQMRTDRELAAHRMEDYPKAVEVMERLGYRNDPGMADALTARYQAKTDGKHGKRMSSWAGILAEKLTALARHRSRRGDG